MFVISVLGKQVPCVFDPSLTDSGKQTAALTGATGLANAVNAVQAQLTDAQTQAFIGVDQVVFFESVIFHHASMTRPFMDQENATFYWEIDEFLAPGVAYGARRPTFYFHDSWHLAQYRATGRMSNDLQEEVDREVDATQRQLEVAQVLGCDAAFIAYLDEYLHNRDEITARIGQGFQAGAAQSRCCSKPVTTPV